MKIDVLCNDGSPLGVTEQSIYGIDGRKGVGGAELALLTMCRAWHDRGDEVTIYNNPLHVNGSVFQQKPINQFRPEEERDILIIFRSPTGKIERAKGKKVWWSCDQFTIGNFKEFHGKVDKLIGISQFHSDYFKTVYGITNMTVIDIPVRDWEYKKEVVKRKHSCIYTSVPDRGLDFLVPIWKEVVSQIPDATLTITSDWSLWSNANVEQAVRQYKMKWAGLKGVEYKSAVNRSDLIDIQLQAEYHLYPHLSQFPELFCISVAESQVAGAIPITSNVGALQTTNRFGYKVEGHPSSKEFRKSFINHVLTQMQSEFQDIKEKAAQEFSLEKALVEWDKAFND